MIGYIVIGVLVWVLYKPVMKFITNLKINQLNEDLDRITDESSDLYVKHRLKYIDYGTGLSRKEQKHNDEMDRLDNEEMEKNFQETGVRETNKEREIREHGDVYLNELQKRFGDEIGLKIKNGELSVGMTKEMVIEMKEEPVHTTQSVSRGKVREEWFYRMYKNRLGKYNYKFRIVIVDGLVEGWNDITN
jgi:hypothetical protein